MDRGLRPDAGRQLNSMLSSTNNRLSPDTCFAPDSKNVCSPALIRLHSDRLKGDPCDFTEGPHRGNRLTPDAERNNPSKRPVAILLGVQAPFFCQTTVGRSPLDAQSAR